MHIHLQSSRGCHAHQRPPKLPQSITITDSKFSSFQDTQTRTLFLPRGQAQKEPHGHNHPIGHAQEENWEEKLKIRIVCKSDAHGHVIMCGYFKKYCPNPVNPTGECHQQPKMNSGKKIVSLLVPGVILAPVKVTASGLIPSSLPHPPAPSPVPHRGRLPSWLAGFPSP